MKRLAKNQSGFGAVEVVLIVFTLFLLVAAGWLVEKNHSKNNTTPVNKLVTQNSQSKADDARRQANIVGIQLAVETYFNSNNHYPSLSELNNASWRQQYTPNLNIQEMQDPLSKQSILAATPEAGKYSYQPTTDQGNSCESNDSMCLKYTLTATLSNGSVFHKSTL